MPRIEWKQSGQKLVLPIAILPSLGSENPQQEFRTTGLLDTGATGSGLRADVVSALGLRPKGKRRVFTANGDIIATEYLFRCGFFPDCSDDPDLAAKIMPFVLENEVLGFDLNANFSYPVLIGMDIISRCDLEVRRTGTAVMQLFV